MIEISTPMPLMKPPMLARSERLIDSPLKLRADSNAANEACQFDFVPIRIARAPSRRVLS
jgi:hypothetical protein